MTGRQLVGQLLDRGHEVRVIVRSRQKLPAEISKHPNTSVTEASVLDLTDEELAERTRGCDAVVSCLGHVMDFKGLFGEPRKLCTDAVRRLCNAIEANHPARPVRFILMNTVGVRNPDLDEKRAWHERALLTVLRHLLPPQRDNETAAEHLLRTVGTENQRIEWCCVRPDSLIDGEISPYEIGESPSTGILSGRPTTRSNVAHLMAELIENDDFWTTWKFRMPVVMNSPEQDR